MTKNEEMSKYIRQLMKWLNDKMTKEQNDIAYKTIKNHTIK